MTVSYDAAEHLIRGRCLPRREALIQSPAWVPRFVRTANKAGKIRLDLDAVGLPPLVSGDLVFITCWAKAGDGLPRRFEVP